MSHSIFLVFAFVLFVIGTFIGPCPPGTPWYSRFNIISAGLAFWVASLLFGR